MSLPRTGRLRRLAEELEENGLELGDDGEPIAMLIEEVDLAVRPPTHERRVVSSGTMLDPTADPATWGPGASLDITRQPLLDQPLPDARRFADGVASWIVRRTDGPAEWLVFDRPAGSERDLVVLAGVLGATIVQRHPSGVVRVVGSFGVLRWNGLAWHREPPVDSWIDAVGACAAHGDPVVFHALLEFAVHDLAAAGIGSLLIYRPDAEPGPAVEERLPTPPPVDIRRPTHLAPLRHALSQIDGAAVFDGDGVLRQLGVRLVPSAAAEASVAAVGGTRHTSARRYSHDDPRASVIVVSEDGPVSVMRMGHILGQSPGARGRTPA